MSGYDTQEHFDGIAEGYNEEISSHIREHLVNKWWEIVSPYFAGDPSVVDIGCGDGTNVEYLRRKGVNAVGMDFSGGLVKRGRERYPGLKGVLFQGSAMDVPFGDNSFDIATMTGVLHHIHSPEDQRCAVMEALRIVRRGGVVVIRECNLINPFFRVFWNYVFPLTAKIDRFGGENWISAAKLEEAFGEAVERVAYFTFLPNFTPRLLFPAAERVERLLEGGLLKKLAAHYVAILRKSN